MEYVYIQITKQVDVGNGRKQTLENWVGFESTLGATLMSGNWYHQRGNDFGWTYGYSWTQEHDLGNNVKVQVTASDWLRLKSLDLRDYQIPGNSGEGGVYPQGRTTDPIYEVQWEVKLVQPG